MATQTRNPTSDEAVSGTWTGSAGSRWQVVDDYPDTTGADELTHGTATAGNLTFGFSAFSIPTGSTGISVAVRYYDYKNGTGAADISARLKIGGSYFNATGHNPSNGSGNRTQRTDTWATNPKTGAAWTVAQINGTDGTNPLQAFGWNSTDANPSITLSSIQIEVTYTPPPSGAGTAATQPFAASGTGHIKRRPLAVWKLNEPSGASTYKDSCASPVDLTRRVSGSDPAAVSIGSGRGLSWSAINSAAGATSAQLTSTKLNGTFDECTLEVVADLVDGDPTNDSTLFGFSNDGASTIPLILGFNGTQVVLYFNTTVVRRWSCSSGVKRITLIFNSKLATEADRAQLYIDGSFVSAASSSTITQNATFSVTSGSGFRVCVGNTGTTDAFSLKGSIYYAAFYDKVLGAAQVNTHHTSLNTNNDLNPTADNYGGCSAAASAFATSGSGSTAVTGFSGTGTAAAKSFATSSSGLERFSGSGATQAKSFAAASSGAERYVTSGSAAVSRFATTSGGSERFSGTATAAPSRFAASASGGEKFTCTASAALSRFAASGIGRERFSGTATAQSAPFAGSGAGAERYAATGSAVASRFATASTGAERFSGSGSAAAQRFAPSAASAEKFSGSGSAAAARFACTSFSAIANNIASGSVALSRFAATSSGAEKFSGAGTAAARSFAPAAAGGERFSGSGSVAAQRFAATSVAKLICRGSGSAAVAPFACSSSGSYTPPSLAGSGSAAARAFSCAGSSVERFVASGTGALSRFGIVGAGSERFVGTGTTLSRSFATSGTALQQLIHIGTGTAALRAFAVAGTGGQRFVGLGSAATQSFGFTGAAHNGLLPAEPIIVTVTEGARISATSTDGDSIEVAVAEGGRIVVTVK